MKTCSPCNNVPPWFGWLTSAARRSTMNSPSPEAAVAPPEPRPKPAKRATIDGNEAVARVAYKTNEVCIIYPITPASPMGEHADQWATQRKPNIWGVVPEVAQMQSEGGAAG